MRAPDALLAGIDDLTRRCTDPHAVGEGVNDLLARWVPYDFSCFATLDPATNLITTVVESDDIGADEAAFAHYEYAVDDVNQLTDIAVRSTPAGILRDDTGGRPEASARYREYLAPSFGFTEELRAVFRTRGLAWGAISLNRAGGRPFSAHEAQVLVAVSEAVALGVRRSLFAAAPPGDSAEPAGPELSRPAVIVVDADGQVAQRTPTVDALLARIEETADGVLPATVLTVVAAARRTAGSPGSAPASARIRTRSGQWLLVQAEPLLGTAATPDMLVVVEPASPRHLTPLALQTYGLTNREEELARLVLRGLDTRAIAETLHLSAHTVQDHLKSVFAKAGVTSRRELIAHVFFDHHAPHLGAGLLSDGSPAVRPLPAG